MVRDEVASLPPVLVARKSLLLLGPRQTGKSTLVDRQFPHALHVDLLDSATFRALSARPERLGQMVEAVPATEGPRVVVVDEIQKVPEILDEVHRTLSSHPELRFVLTGSSARKLRRGGVNLLGGRASRIALHPLVWPETVSDPANPVSVDRSLQWGGLPPVVTSTDPRQDLLDYVDLYLREEIQAEAAVRSLSAFTRFLEVAATTNGEQVVFANVARDSEVPARTVRDYFQVLEDTLLGTLLPAYRGTSKRKPMASAKFFFFDVGVANALQGRFSLVSGTAEYGRALEHRVFCELRAALDYQRSTVSLSYWRSLSRLEVDFVLTAPGMSSVAVEVKATRNVAPKDTRGLRSLAEELPGLRCIVVCLEPHRRMEDRVEIMPVLQFLGELWGGRVLPR